MPRTEITKDWSIDIDADFEREVEEGDLMLHKPGRTIYAAVYTTNNLDAEQVKKDSRPLRNSP